jgi:hypothetical protein
VSADGLHSRLLTQSLVGRKEAKDPPSITFTSDGNPDNRPSVLAPDMSLINQDKYNKLGKIAMDFARYQEVSTRPSCHRTDIESHPLQPFNFHELEAVQNFLRRVLAERGSGSLDALYRKSRESPRSECLDSSNPP